MPKHKIHRTIIGIHSNYRLLIFIHLMQYTRTTAPHQNKLHITFHVMKYYNTIFYTFKKKKKIALNHNTRNSSCWKCKEMATPANYIQRDSKQDYWTWTHKQKIRQNSKCFWGPLVTGCSTLHILIWPLPILLSFPH